MVIKVCLFCGKNIEKKKYVCEECEEKIKKLKQITRIDDAALKMKKAHKKYLHNEYGYEKEKEIIAEKIISRGFSFNSKDEVCFALQLEKENIEYIPNYKIENYQVDFFLPKIKKIVEIDGELYHTDENKDYFRERAIMHFVGEEYEIIRIPANDVQEVTIGDIPEMLDYIKEKRLTDHRFRDTRYDEVYLLGYLREKRKREKIR